MTVDITYDTESVCNTIPASPRSLRVSQRERGQNICNDLSWHGLKAEWFIDSSGELFLLLNGRQILRCIGDRSVHGLTRPYWQPSPPFVKDFLHREITSLLPTVRHAKRCLSFYQKDM